MQSRVHFIADEPWKFAVTPAALCCLEELTGRRADAYVGDIRDARNRTYTRVYELGYALSASYREANGIDMSFADFRNLCPVGGKNDPEWSGFAMKMNDLVTLNFFGQTWAEHLQAWEILVQAALKEAGIQETTDPETLSERLVSLTGDAGPTTSGVSSDTASTPLPA